MGESATRRAEKVKEDEELNEEHESVSIRECGTIVGATCVSSEQHKCNGEGISALHHSFGSLTSAIRPTLVNMTL